MHEAARRIDEIGAILPLLSEPRSYIFKGEDNFETMEMNLEYAADVLFGGGVAAHDSVGNGKHCTVCWRKWNSGNYYEISIGGVIGKNAGTIQYCRIECESDGRISGNTVGGVAGYNSGEILACESACTIVEKTGPNGLALGGGIVGFRIELWKCIIMQVYGNYYLVRSLCWMCIWWHCWCKFGYY